MQNKKVLIAPLNWGLGHATRCIPIITELHRQGAEVILASDGVALDLLKSEFPNLKIHRIPNAGHWLQHEEPLEVNSAIRAFLTSTPKS